MATNSNVPNPNPNPPQEDPNALTPQQIRDRAAGQQPQQTPPAPTQQPPAPQPGQQPPQQQPPAGPQPPTQQPPPQQAAPSNLPRPQRQQDGSFVIQLPTGQRYVGRNEQEAYDNLATAQISASTTIRDLREQADRFQRGIQVLSGAPAVDPATGTPKPVFEPAIYKSLQEQDPMTAQLYLLQNIFELNSIDEVIPAINDMRYQTRDYAYQMAINKFRAGAPDFPGTQQAVDTLMDTMKAHNLGFTADNLIMVHNALKQQNRYPQGAFPQQQPQQPQQFAPQQPPQQPAYNPNPNPFQFQPGRGFNQFQPPPPPPQQQPQPPFQASPYAQPPGFGPAPYNPYAQPQNPYAPAPPQMAAGGFPPMPQQQIPIPAGPQGAPGFAPGNGQPNEDALNLLPRDELKRQIEANLFTR
jgi:hypothetical protein